MVRIFFVLLFISNLALGSGYFGSSGGGGSGGNVESISAKTGTFTISASDTFTVYTVNSSSACTANLPDASTVAAGTKYRIVDISGDAAKNNITIDPNASQTINGGTTYTINIDRADILLMSDGTSAWIIL